MHKKSKTSKQKPADIPCGNRLSCDKVLSEFAVTKQGQKCNFPWKTVNFLGIFRLINNLLSFVNVNSCLNTWFEQNFFCAVVWPVNKIACQCHADLCYLCSKHNMLTYVYNICPYICYTYICDMWPDPQMPRFHQCAGRPGEARGGARRNTHNKYFVGFDFGLGFFFWAKCIANLCETLKYIFIDRSKEKSTQKACPNWSGCL